MTEPDQFDVQDWTYRDAVLKNFDQYVLGIKWIKIDIEKPSDWDHFLRLVSLEYIYQVI